MSRRNSVGDLVPRDIMEILAREARANKAKKTQSGSFSRALGWLRGPKKKAGSCRPAHGARGGVESQAAKHGHHQQDSAKAAAKQDDDPRLTVHYQVTPHYQENVFIEGSRPRYLEDLHSEAQEGLRSLQQGENSNGLDYQDTQSVSSTTTLQPGSDPGIRERKGSLESGSTAADSTSVRSSLNRQGSTFKPLNPVRRLERPKKRSRRTTIMGLPHHVHKELGLDRETLFKQNVAERLPNGEGGALAVVVIPTIDGEAPAVSHEGARVHLQDLEVLQSSREEELLEQHIRAVYRDDLALCPKLQLPMRRPKSLAVPGMTTLAFPQDPQGPVMSISPQATYLSKIIPNAILPAAVDVIEIDRSRSRSSVRTVSKSSLASASPASSRSRPPKGPSSASSNWSHSQSSETVISNSSTISSKGSTGAGQAPNGHGKEGERGRQPAPDQVSLGSATSWVSSASAGAKPQTESVACVAQEGDKGEDHRSDNSCSRNVSVTKMKLPPAPPRRTYSLHHENVKEPYQETANSGNFEDRVRKIPGANGVKHNNALEEAVSPNSTDSYSLGDSRSSVSSGLLCPDIVPGSGESSPQKLPFQGNKFERTLSPSSGYSSQSGTPTLSAKEIHPPSPALKKTKPPKPERVGSRASPTGSVSSSLTSLSSVLSEPAHQQALTNGVSSHVPKTSPPAPGNGDKANPAPRPITHKDLFNIPPPPKVRAPCPPPPETWLHNKRTFELLCGPRAALNSSQKQQPKACSQTQKHQAQNIQLNPAEGQLPGEDLTARNKGEKLHSQTDPTSGQTAEPSLECVMVPPAVQTEGPVNQETEQDNGLKPQEPRETSEDQQNSRTELLQQELTNQKRDQEGTVMLKQLQPLARERGSPVEHKKDNGTANDLENLPSEMKQFPPEIKVHNLTEDTLSAPQKKDAEVNSHIVEASNTLQSSKQKLSAGGSRQVSVSPPPSPPPTHHPPPPPLKKTNTTLMSGPTLDDHLVNPIAESSWPPPPPPMEETSAQIFEGQDEPDFPPPPPPLLPESQLDGAENISDIPEIYAVLGTSDERTLEEKTAGELMPSTVSELPADKGCEQLVKEKLQREKESEFSPAGTITVHPKKTSMLIQPECTIAQSSKSQSQFPQLLALSQEPPALPESIPPPPQESPPPPPSTVIPTASPVSASPVLPHPAVTSMPEGKRGPIGFKRPGTVNRDSRVKEELSRSKNSPVPKEEANIPLVTPSLLQMVRLRSVNVSDDLDTNSTEDNTTANKDGCSQDQNQTQSGSHAVPQKPIRKSLSVKSAPAGASTSMRLQEAIRMKTAAMTSKDGLPARPSLRSSISPTSSGESGARSPEGGDIHKSPASTASFIFSRSTKKVVIETPSSPEVQSSLKQSLAMELKQVTDSNSILAAAKSGAQSKRLGKVPPPVAKKPGVLLNHEDKLVNQSMKMENRQSQVPRSKANGHTGVQPAGQQARQKGGKESNLNDGKS